MDKIPEKSVTTKTLKRRYEKSEKSEHCTVFQEERGPKCLMIIPSLGSKTLGTFRTLIAPAHWQGKHWIDNNIYWVTSHSRLIKINFFLFFMFSFQLCNWQPANFQKSSHEWVGKNATSSENWREKIIVKLRFFGREQTIAQRARMESFSAKSRFLVLVLSCTAASHNIVRNHYNCALYCYCAIISL